MGFTIGLLIKSILLGLAVYWGGLAEWTYLTRNATSL